jgi:serine/threonine protein phosphatase PrpC
MLDVEFAQLSDPGRQRANNEDYLGHVAPGKPEAARTHGWLFALADGVGGQEKGEVASRGAVESVLAGFRAAPALIPRLVQTANSVVFEMGRAVTRGATAMATTLVVCALRFDRVIVSHAGDSRCYLIRRGVATPLTRDHTLANEHIRLGIVSAKDARDARTRQMLTRSVGNDLMVKLDTSEHMVQAGDVLLLCSDGLHGPVDESEMAGIVTGHADLSAAAQALVSVANERDGSDNISVQLIRVRGVERVGMYRGRPYKLR